MNQQQIKSLFNRVSLSDRELTAGRVLNSLQIAVLNEERMDIAEEILNLTYDGTVEKDIKYALRLAELQGQLGFLTYLIELSAETEVQSNASNQPTQTEG